MCSQQTPELQQVEESHWAKCSRWKEAGAPRPSEAKAEPLREARPSGPPILETQSIKKYYSETRHLAKWLGFPAPVVKAVDDVSFHVEKGDVFALVGESGCGKTTLGRVITRLLKPTSGRVRFYRHGTNREEIFLRDEFRRAVQIVFQHPDSSLNPMKRIRSIIERPLKIQGLSGREREKRAGELLELVKLDQGYLTRYPKQLSGGEKQRVAMARAFAMNPDFIVLDEPVSSLDVSIQASIIALLMELKAAMDLSFLFISHDLSLVRHIASRVGVMYLGRLCELGEVEELFSRPCHPYTRALLSSIPIPDPSVSKRPIRLEGSVPSARNPPQGCRFNTRCPSKQGRICEVKSPELVAISEGHWVACHIPPDRLVSPSDLGEAGTQ
jgi:peptide/nickel transport system ATP-binding protein